MVSGFPMISSTRVLPQACFSYLEALTLLTSIEFNVNEEISS